MTLARIISIGIVAMFALAVGIASFDPSYAGLPCCTLKDGTWIVNKTGKPASPAQIRTMQPSQPSTAHAVPCCHTPTPKPSGGAAIGTSGGGGGHNK